MGKREFSFRLSDLLPNSWLCKLKDMRTRRNRVSRGQKAHNSRDKSQIRRTEPLKSLENQSRSSLSPTTQPYTTNRPSSYVPSRDRAEKLLLSPTQPKASDTHFPLDSPRKSKKKPKKKPLNPSVSNSHPAPEIPLDDEFVVSASDIIISEHDLPLPPILTKPRLLTGRKQSPKQGSLVSHGSMKRSPSGTQQIKMRIKSPRLVTKRVEKRKGLAESFVVVKSSSDPKRDFRESMVDMIIENNLCSWKELEELLTCYLSLNSSEYHDLIVEVFEQIWFDLTDIIV